MVYVKAETLIRISECYNLQSCFTVFKILGDVIKLSARDKAFKLSHEINPQLDLHNHLPYRVAVVSNLLALNRDWKIREVCDLDPREIRVLLNIGSYMPIKAADIAYQSRIDSYNVSRAVKALQKRSLIDLQPATHSKNIKYLVLNEQGQALYQQVTSAMNARTEALEHVLTADERKLFIAMLEKLENNAEKVLAEQALSKVATGQTAPADQKELIRWYNKSHAATDCSD